MIRHALPLAAFGLLAVAGFAQAGTGFSGPYGPSQATVVAQAGGWVDTSGAPASITIYGGSDESGASTNSYGFTVQGTGTLSFSWNYTQDDCCGSVWDPFGYTLNGTFYQLTVDYNGETEAAAFAAPQSDNFGDLQSGSVSISVAAGDVFAFEQRSIDSSSGYATTVISDFDAPTTAAPEPATWALMTAGVALTGAALRRRKVPLAA